MFDANWDMINGVDAHEIEVLNQSNQANLIEALVRFLKHHDKTPGESCAICPGQSILKELHRTGTLLLLASAGNYRDCEVQVRRRDGRIFEPPPRERVPELMEQFERELQKYWLAETPVALAAFCLWRINWVHPFKNGNGRTARAFAYACVCLKFGFMLPGTVTMIDLIMGSREEYEAALGHADETYARTGAADLRPMQAYVEDVLRRQLESIPIDAGGVA